MDHSRIYTCIILLNDFFKVYTATTLRPVHGGTAAVLIGVNINCENKMNNVMSF